MRPVFGDLLDDLNDVRSLGAASRRVLRRQGPAHAAGSHRPRQVPPGLLRQRLARLPCRTSLWAAIGPGGFDARRSAGARPEPPGGDAASRTGFMPGLIPDTMRATNRPTFQQVLEFAHR